MQCVCSEAVAWQVNAIAFDAAAKDDLPPYNATYVYLLVHCFTRLTDFKVLLDPESWGVSDGGESPFDCEVAGCEVLTSKTLAYWDFLVAHSPWNQTTHGGVKVTTGIKEEVLAAMDGCQQEHETRVHMQALAQILKENFTGKKLANVVLDEEVGAPPPKRSRDILKELEAGSAAEKSANLGT